MVKQTGLGKGLGSLIPGNFDRSVLLNNTERVERVLVDDILPAKDQPRTTFNEETLRELADSIKTHGILQPIIITPHQNNSYMLIAGERRWRAARLAGLTHLPAIIRTAKDLERLELALIENIQREDLSPLDKAKSLLNLYEQFNLTHKELGRRLGMSQPTFTNTLRLLNLPQKAKEALQAGKISESHARSILALDSMPDKQDELLRLIIKNGWSARQAERFVIACKTGAKTAAQAKQRTQAETPQTKKLAKHLSRPVSLLRMAKGKGKLMIEYRSEKDLERLLEKLIKS